MTITERNHIESYLGVIMSEGHQVVQKGNVEMSPGLGLLMQCFIILPHLHYSIIIPILTTLPLCTCVSLTLYGRT